MLVGGNVAASTFWHGALLSRWAHDWVAYQTNGQSAYAVCGMEDSGTLQSLTFLARAERVDLRRVLVLRAASNFDQQRRGRQRRESLAETKIRSYSAYLPALQSAYLVGHTWWMRWSPVAGRRARRSRYPGKVTFREDSGSPRPNDAILPHVPQIFRSHAMSRCISPVLSLFAGAALLLPQALFSQVVPAPLIPQVGSSNPVSAEPNVPRPTTAPCAVPLFTDLQFADYGTKPIAYTPGTGTGCAGPWSKVVLTADFTVTAGRQFDRTAKFYLGGANIYFGTTAEPRATLSPSWHIERDVTDLSALFSSPQTGVASIQNIVNSTYTGVIYASAQLLFYPANAANPAAVVPDQVLSFPVNDTASLNTTADQAKGSFTFPLNLERVYLDVIAESQGNDEFWYLCVPSGLAGELQSCGNTAFRETEVSIDGKPAGVAPIYPWIYTGGIDPYLWEPITGIETLNFKPYRVDLTPFAGV